MSELDYVAFKSRVDALIGEVLSGFRERHGYDPGEHHLEFARPGEDASILASAFGSYLHWTRTSGMVCRNIQCPIC